MALVRRITFQMSGVLGFGNLIKRLTCLLPDQIFYSPYCQPNHSYSVSLENLELNQLIILKLIFFFILITFLVDIVLIL